jgi:hypothetical protein
MYPLIALYLQTAAIDISNCSWLPIGTSIADQSFYGTFDGGGFTVTGLTVDAPTLDWLPSLIVQIRTRLLRHGVSQ